MNDKKNIRRAPVAIVGSRKTARRALARARSGLLEAEPHSEPLPGTMLVLLSRLHRAERLPNPEDEGGFP